LIQLRLPNLDLVARIAPGIILHYIFIIRATAPLDPHPAILHATPAIEAKADSVGAGFHPTRKAAIIVLEASKTRAAKISVGNYRSQRQRLRNRLKKHG